MRRAGKDENLIQLQLFRREEMCGTHMQKVLAEACFDTFVSFLQVSAVFCSVLLCFAAFWSLMHSFGIFANV